MSDLILLPGGVLVGTGGVYTVAAAAPPPSGAIAATLTMSDAASTSTTNYPVQQGYAFKEGDVADYPQAVVAGTPVDTQAHVETRWTDGSVKTAVLFFHVPSLPSGGSRTITFQNQSTSNTTGGLSAATVLADWDFDAVIEITKDAITRTMSARTMLAAGHYWTLYSGPIATCFIIEDHSASPAYDVGWDAYTPVRPVFHATFYPLTGQTCVRYIVENGCKTQQVAETTVSTITLKLGQATPSTVYTKASSTRMHYASRWTKQYWKGGTPATINFDLDLTYLASTKLLPNYDTSLVMQEADIAGFYGSWTAATKDIYNEGNWQLPMSNTGGYHRIGLQPGWTVWWLYTGDHRMREMAFGNADLAGAFHVHYRESEYGRTRSFQRNSGTDAGGKVVSINTRPSLCFQTGNGVTTSSPLNLAADKMTWVTSMSEDNYSAEASHQPDPYTAQYLLTGDYWYLEQSWFFAAWSAAYPSPADVSYGGRGPDGWYGGLELGAEPRAHAWPFRNRVATAVFTPDRFADEKAYFTYLVADAIEVWEGHRNVTSSRTGGALWNWAYAHIAQSKWGTPLTTGPDPMNSWAGGGQTDVPDAVNYELCYRSGSPWMHHYLLVCLYRAKELGFDTGPLLGYAAPHLIEVITDPGISSFHLENYRRPYRKLPYPDGDFYTSWAEVASHFHTSYDTNIETNWISSKGDLVNGRSNIAMAAAAAVYDETDGPTAWAWIETHARGAADLVALATNPKWALRPRNLP